MPYEYSFCCDAKIVNGICSDCGDHADPEEQEQDSTPVPHRWVTYMHNGVEHTKIVYEKRGAANSPE